MSKIYHENVLGYSCILSENRKNRPYIDKNTEDCPFCFGHEDLLENIWIEIKEEEPFNVRIVNNKYAVCDKDVGLYGIHDVVIDTPYHEQKPKDFSQSQWDNIFKAIWQRWHILRQEERIKFIQVFKNYGKAAGASITHSHWQIIALEEVPLTIKMQYDSFYKVSKQLQQCPICHKVNTLPNDYLLLANENWIALAPEASGFAYETWIIPKKHVKNYGELDEKDMHALGQLLSVLLKALNMFLGDIAYNICFVGSQIEEKVAYHFFIRLVPRVGNWAGFELSTGCFINTIDPLIYVQKMREALAKMRGDTE